MDQKEARRILGEVGTRHMKAIDFDSLDLISAGVPSQKWFDRCTFIGADLRFATLDGAWFLRCDFTDANLRGSSLRGVSFSGCDLRGADLRECDLTSARFSAMNTGTDSGCTNVEGAQFDGAQLVGVVVEDVIGWAE